MFSIASLVAAEKAELIHMGSNWVKDDNAPKDSFVKGCVYVGKIPFVNCNDVFWWGCADGEEFDFKDVEDLKLMDSCINDCNGNIYDGAMLYCARKREYRPQGAMYTYIDKENWHLFDACGPEREIGFGNPYKPGEYKTR